MAEDLKKRAGKIVKIIGEHFPDAQPALNYRNPLQLLVATILSAQCTDQRVNIVTGQLFRKYKNAGDFAGADIAELEQDIRSTGFYRNKAKNIKSCCTDIVEKYKGKVPDTMEQLVELAGIGRKTANVVLGNAFGKPGIVVDTHVGRIARRTGLTSNTDAVKVEFDLMELIPKDKWTIFSNQLILHGRAICKARKPECGECPVLKYCDYGREQSD
ncbi:MAG TPA: endonuclease III [bacterium]|nr:endonuclease III [bacterium]